MPDVERKAVAQISVKEADRGTVSALVAEAGAVSLDGNVIRHQCELVDRQGVLTSSAKVCMGGFRDAKGRPIGTGTLAHRGGWLQFDARMFMTTRSGADTFQYLREMGEDQQWELSYRALRTAQPNDVERKQGALRVITRLQPIVVEPALLSSSPRSQTLAVKTVRPTPLTTEQQAELQRIAADFERRDDEIKLMAIADRVHRELDPRKHGVDAFDRYGQVIEFGCSKLAMPPSEWPDVRLVPRYCIGSKTAGIYRPRDHLVAIADDMSDDDKEVTILHELTHAWQKLRGKEMTESFPEMMERELFSEWQYTRARRYPWRYGTAA